jgi:hypothetical protein
LLLADLFDLPQLNLEKSKGLAADFRESLVRSLFTSIVLALVNVWPDLLASLNRFFSNILEFESA